MGSRSNRSPIVPFEVSPFVSRQVASCVGHGGRDAPPSRPLRIYTLDPSVSDIAGGVATVEVPYETLQPGPRGALFDIRPEGAPGEVRAAPLDLDDPLLLLTDGLTPSPSDGRFHLQMTYAVCSLTHAAFVRALGRDIGWAVPPQEDGSTRLRVRPFGFEGRNAGYSREAGDLAFGFFRAGKSPGGFVPPGGTVFTCLSHDIVAHETTHAILDGLRPSFHLPTNVDVIAFHEAFADLVALFLHFAYPDVVRAALRDAGGALSHAGLLTDLAREFGHARSRPGRDRALRSGIDVDEIAGFDSDRLPGDGRGPRRYDASLEPHELGSVLVSAVFEAYTTVVRRKTERYFRIAGIDPASPPSRRSVDGPLLDLIAKETSDVAGQFLTLCIRAVEYCPPSDMELGEFLRALITADGEVERKDKWGFRDALMRSFRRRHIFPEHVRFMTEDALRWSPPDEPVAIPALAFRSLTFEGDPGHPSSRKELLRQATELGKFVTHPKRAAAFRVLSPAGPLPKGVVQASPVQVQSLRVARRSTPDGRIVFDLVAELVQSCVVRDGKDLFEMHGGSTVVLDPEGDVRYVIYKRLDSKDRRDRQRGAIRGALREYWVRAGGRLVPRPEVFRRIDGRGHSPGDKR